MLFHLCNIMGHVVYDVHVQIIRCGVKHLGKGLPSQKSHTASVDPSKVSCSCHSIEVVLTLLGLDPGTGQLSVIYLYLVSLHSFLHCHQSICSHLMTKPSTATVNHQYNLANSLNPHLT